MTNALFAQPSITSQEGPDGSILLRSTHMLSDYPQTVMHSFGRWAAQDPDHVLVAERATVTGPGGR